LEDVENDFNKPTTEKPLTGKEKINALLQAKKRNKDTLKRQSFHRQRLIKAFKGKGDTSTIKILPSKTRQQRAFNKIGNLFGVNVILFKSTDPNINNFNGFTYPDSNDIFVNAANDNNIMAIIGHETMHQFEVQHPEEYKELVKALKSNVKNYKTYSDKLKRVRGVLGAEELTDTEVFDEFVADFSGDQFQNGEFLEKLSQENPNLFNKLVKILADIVRKLKSITNRAEKHIIDVEKAQADLLSAFGKALRVSRFENAKGKGKLQSIELANPFYSQLLKSV